ncbi:protein phosphatase 1 regulatory subunit Sds22p [[Candida] railenensis]|uniref:Protein phosphatase 1 regulatory subunit Sds22p n=1 Tax=[Candida] railenensis TaxID=45579 RepID=A0A9P0VWF9_9ASCO|nr:protein phosphatase 1 regulatory subunit Sds22p [[Candida] railenensis]
MMGDNGDNVSKEVETLPLREATEGQEGQPKSILKHGNEIEPEYNSSSEEEDENDDEDDDVNEEDEPLPTQYPGTIIPDDHPEEIDADVDLAATYPDDTEYIDLIHLKITSLEALNLERFSKIESLCLRQNLLTSMSAIKHLPKETMEELDLYDNRINHISKSVSLLTNLKNLDFSFNKIKHIKHLETLTKLENLYFVQNKIKEIKNLETLTNLKNLELGGNKIETIEPESLNSLVNLQQLWLGKNRISKFENLNNLHNLKILSIQSNRLTKIEGLEHLKNLEELYLSHNGISKIENLEENTNLQVLDVTSNKLTNLEGLSHLTKLTDFWCSYNKISSFEEIGKELSKLPELDTVYFEGNPVQTQSPTAYRRKLRLYLGPSLTKIDATYVKE